MWLSTSLTAVLAASGTLVAAYPGMGATLAQIQARKDDKGDSFELLGDLAYLKEKNLTPVGKDLVKLLTGKGDPESNEKYKDVPGLNSPACKQDTCCVWRYVADDMFKLFQGKSGRCTKWARFAIRLGFHDAGTWSKQTAHLGGGADGSIVLSGSEIGRGENSGLADIADKMQKWYDKYRGMGFTTVTMADLIQVGASVATVTCPLGPRMKTYVGRNDSSTPAPDGLLPDVFASADSLIQLFRDKTIGPHGLVALVGAHTTSQQQFVNASRRLDPQDSTPGVWDVLFYGETLGKKNGGVKAPNRVFKFPADIALSKHPETKKEWKEFAGSGGQDHWNEDFAREYIRLSILGVDSPNSLVECTKILPPEITGFTSKDQKKIDKWLKSKDNTSKSKKVSQELFDGDEITLPEAEIPAPIEPEDPEA